MGPGYKEKKKLQIGIYIVLKNYKYTKFLFLNTLRCNHLPKKIKIKKFFTNTRLARNNFFFFVVVVEVRAFIGAVLKI